MEDTFDVRPCKHTVQNLIKIIVRLPTLDWPQLHNNSWYKLAELARVVGRYLLQQIALSLHKAYKTEGRNASVFWITLCPSLSVRKSLPQCGSKFQKSHMTWHDWCQKPWWQKLYEYFSCTLYNWILISLVSIFFCWFNKFKQPMATQARRSWMCNSPSTTTHIPILYNRISTQQKIWLFFFLPWGKILYLASCSDSLYGTSMETPVNGRVKSCKLVVQTAVG